LPQGLFIHRFAAPSLFFRITLSYHLLSDWTFHLQKTVGHPYVGALKLNETHSRFVLSLEKNVELRIEAASTFFSQQIVLANLCVKRQIAFHCWRIIVWTCCSLIWSPFAIPKLLTKMPGPSRTLASHYFTTIRIQAHGKREGDHRLSNEGLRALAGEKKDGDHAGPQNRYLGIFFLKEEQEAQMRAGPHRNAATKRQQWHLFLSTKAHLSLQSRFCRKNAGRSLIWRSANTGKT
jgi:hypothetical protein